MLDKTKIVFTNNYKENMPLAELAYKVNLDFSMVGELKCITDFKMITGTEFIQKYRLECGYSDCKKGDYHAI